MYCFMSHCSLPFKQSCQHLKIMAVMTAGPSSQGYSPSASMGGNGGLQAPQQYPQPTSHKQPSPQNQNWEATGGLSPSQQQAVQELSEMGFDARQSQVHIPARLPPPNSALLLICDFAQLGSIILMRQTFACVWMCHTVHLWPCECDACLT